MRPSSVPTSVPPRRVRPSVVSSVRLVVSSVRLVVHPSVRPLFIPSVPRLYVVRLAAVATTGVRNHGELECDLSLVVVNDLCKYGVIGIKILASYHKLLESIVSCNSLRKRLQQQPLCDAGLVVDDIHIAYTKLALSQALVRPLKKGETRTESLQILSQNVRCSRVPTGSGLQKLIAAHWPDAFGIVEALPPITDE